MSDHLDRLFSAAVDDALSSAEAVRFRAHMDRCPSCADSWNDYRAMVDAVRALPMATMPVRVTLPLAAPQAELSPVRRLSGVAAAAAGVRERFGWGPAGGAAALAALGIAAVVLAVHHSGAPPAASGVASAGGAGAEKQFHADDSIAGGCGRTPRAVPTSAAPAGFGYSVSVDDPAAPGEHLVLATTATQVAAGQRLLVYARLATSGPVATGAAGTGPQSASVLPCVALEAQSVTAAGVPQPGGASGSAQAAAGAPAPPLELAAPTSSVTAADGPFQVLTVPSTAARGAVLRLVASIPGPGGPVTAVLTITVT